MTSHKHAWTKGPWIAASAYSSVVGIPIVAQTGKRIANTSMPGFPDDYGNDETNLANARLISAAPEMYEALKKAEELYQVGIIAAPNGLFDEVQELRRAALTKAEGGAG